MKVFAVSVFVLGLTVNWAQQFKNVNLLADLLKAVDTGNVYLNSVGDKGVPAIQTNPGSTSSQPLQATVPEGGQPTSVELGPGAKNSVSFNVQRKEILRTLETLDERMVNLEKYFIDKGVLSSVEKTTEKVPKVPSFSKRRNPIDDRMKQITDRIDALNEAIEAYKIENPVSEAPESPYTEGQDTQFSDRIFSGYFSDDDLYDVSSIAVSLTHKDIIYATNDRSSSRNLNQIYVVNATTGEVHNTMTLAGATNNDWEDMAVAPCSVGSKTNCIYIGDIGKGKDGRPANNIYKVVEPADPYTLKTAEIEDIISFTGVTEVDMETLMVSPDLKMYVIPEAKNTQKLYRIDGTKATKMCEISVKSGHTAPTSGDISSCGTMALLKADEYVYFYYVPDGDYEAAFCNPNPTVHRLQYTEERVNQAIAFDPSGLWYYTVQEEEYSPIWKYKRLRVEEV